jgi:hypothetical protein
MLLNKIPVLDKGFVAAISSHNDGQKLQDIADNFMNPVHADTRVFDISSLTLLVKCPLFVQLNISQFGFTIMNTRQEGELEAYIPNETEIGAPELEVNKLISDDIMRTTNALFINPKAYQADGCDRFISQVIMPINTYTTIIVHGSYDRWKRLVAQQNLPLPLEAYRSAIGQIFTAEWNYGKTKRFEEQDQE